MIDSDRVMQVAYLSGEARVELGFNWDGEPMAVTAHFRRFIGSRFSARRLEPGITLEGITSPGSWSKARKHTFRLS